MLHLCLRCPSLPLITLFSCVYCFFALRRRRRHRRRHHRCSLAPYCSSSSLQRLLRSQPATPPSPQLPHFNTHSVLQFIMQQRTPNADRVAQVAASAPDNEFLVCATTPTSPSPSPSTSTLAMFAVIANFRGLTANKHSQNQSHSQHQRRSQSRRRRRELSPSWTWRLLAAVSPLSPSACLDAQRLCLSGATQWQPCPTPSPSSLRSCNPFSPICVPFGGLLSRAE